ncbi:MAG: nucleotidyltransferase domain-containing protein [Selenomonadaceae bacterium]|nr:nucleotidyltransferase domain-containing protein [Selenomonadaceae bacterium]
MTLQTKTQNLLEQYVKLLQPIYGSHLKNVILFGSYARGDYNDDSDIDVMILLDLDDDSMKLYRKELCANTNDFNMDNDVFVQIITVNINTFTKWKMVHPLYVNVVREGVSIYDAAA